MERGVFDFFSSDPDTINKHLQSGKAVCMLLNKDLPGPSIVQGISYGYVLVVEYNGEERLAVAHGCYKKPIKRFDLPDPEVLRKCKKVQSLTEGIYPKKIFKKHLEDPLSILLHTSLTDEQLEMFKRNYEVFGIEHEDEMHNAIACVYFNPNYETEGKVIAQWYE